MRNLKITLIIILGFIVIGLALVMAYCIKFSGGLDFFHYGNTASLVQERTIEAGNIKDVTIDYSKNSYDIYIYTTDESDFTVKEYMSGKASQNEYASIDTNNDKLLIRGVRQQLQYFFNNNYGYIEVYVPKAYIDSISVISSSGNIEFPDDQTFDNISITSSSGDVSIFNLKGTTTNIATSSGNVESDSLEGDKNISSSSGNISIYNGNGNCNMSANSGNITIDKLNGKFAVETSSGDIDITGKSGYGTVKASSGNVDISLDEIKGDIEAAASSGNVSLYLPENAELKFSADASSGDIDTFFDADLAYNKDNNSCEGNVGINPVNHISINTQSGNISVIKN